MSLRTTKKDEAFYEVLSVFDESGVDLLSDEEESDFTVSFYADGVAATGDDEPAYSISEIDSTGQYLLTVTNGFSSTGFWMVSVLDSTEYTHRTDIEVRTRDIDDIYSVIAGGFGTQTVVLTVLTEDTDTPVASMRASVWNSESTTFITFGQTDSSGEVSFSLDPDEYSVKFFKPGVSIDAYTLTVEEDDDIQEFEISATAVEVSPPDSPEVCRIYADFVDQGGSAIEDFKITVTNLFSPSSSSGLSVVEGTTSYETNSEGHVEFDVVRGTKVKVSLVTTGLTRDITAPDQAVANLLTLLGSATDPFQVVEDDSDPFVVVSVG